jgi:hypothetical protein
LFFLFRSYRAFSFIIYFFYNGYVPTGHLNQQLKAPLGA